MWAVNLIKYVWDVYAENYKILKKNSKIFINGEVFCVHGLEDSILLRCQFFPMWSIDSNNHNENPNKLFVDIDKLTLKLIWRGKSPRIKCWF